MEFWLRIASCRSSVDAANGRADKMAAGGPSPTIAWRPCDFKASAQGKQNMPTFLGFVQLLSLFVCVFNSVFPVRFVAY